MSLIQKREFSIGKIVLVWDWFEATKWLSFLNGVLLAFALMLIFMLEYSSIKMPGLAKSLILIIFLLIGIIGYAINIIREDAVVNKLG